MQLSFINKLLVLLLNPFLVFTADICDPATFPTFLNPEREHLLKAHNDLRKRIAEGTEENYNGRLPSAKNMYQLIYDCQMEKKLQDEIEKCTGRATFAKEYGQNMFASSVPEVYALTREQHVKTATEIWMAPLKQYGLEDVEKYDDDRLYTFANMAYAKTLRFGCAYKKCDNNNPQEVLVSCIYNLIGGFNGNVLYEKGPKCAKNKECTTYDGSTCVQADGLCKYTKKPPLPGGGVNTICKNAGMSDQGRNAIVQEHNTKRSLLARGKIRNGKNPNNKNLPTASYMPRMVYECNLEAEAMDYANTCSLKKSEENERFDHGENVYVYNAPNADPAKALKEAAESWWNQIFADGINWEVKFAQSLRDKPIDQKGFTQMAWGRSVQIGCGIKTCARSSFVVCRYKPAGNKLNEPIYKRGPVCSGCTAACNTTEGLCNIL